ncbi:hypothetical protein BU251_07655 [Candidatus Velamenicoccus archaeovorus]|uniref:Putative zinc-finger domain-containing protein n=1 Tax=Velamenicoccus archaeovorus TaxID=1930593 RepID=A0A410P5Z8_VELA1|nr:zf-HC2 domain-containing protein [Candidatus Velamenicoccus archaeovorus]QAT17599.1 hypothetical protein BU251_07655 [Candidatus Velamenicoccus archaeovorus]
MNACARTRRLLSRYIDKEAAKRDAAFIETHVAGCFSCRKELRELSCVREVLLKKERRTLPEGELARRLLREVLRRRSGQEDSSPGGMGYFARRLIFLPAIGIALSAAFLILVPQQTNRYSWEEHILSGAPTTTAMTLGLLLGARVNSTP